MIPVHSVTDNFSFEQLAKLPRTSLRHGWNLKPQTEVAFALAQSPSGLWFLAYCNQEATCRRDIKAGDFIEDLWKQDVFEIFLGEHGSNCYREFNFSPLGAWWTASFNAPRVRSNPQAIPMAVKVELLDHGATFFIPELSLTKQSALNVTAIVAAEPRQYFSYVDLPGDSPDFHQPSFFPIVQSHSVQG